MEKEEEESRILFMSTYPPRECGIATFTKDLTDAIGRRLTNSVRTKILAMNNNGLNIYNYPKKVEMEISDTNIQDYINYADEINSRDDIKLVCIQHEFGIFGGQYGDFLLPFLEVLQKPAVITFHSVLPTPNEQLKRVVKAISERVNEIIVMTPKGSEILKKDYNVKTKISVIPHGIPSVTLEDQEREKKTLGLTKKLVLTSFGLINRGKGYEYVIESLPEIVKQYPNLIYIIIGETHPNVRRIEGESYRNFLSKRIKSLGLEKHVKFYNKYVTLQEIIQYLKASDLYICSNLDKNQITSGTLSYALGCGRVAVSTPFLHAKDALTPERGILVDFKSSVSFKKAIFKLLREEQLRKEMEKKAYFYMRNATWQNVANSYIKLFKPYLNLKDPQLEKLPAINTSHLLNLTDDFGIIQFANQTTPDIESGYTLDDNARALLVCAMHYEKVREFKQLELIKRYLDYIKYVQDKSGKLYNYVDKHKNIDLVNWSQDAHGRALWALGYISSSKSIPEDFKRKADEIFLKALTVSSDIESPRAISFIINGLYHFNQDKNSKYIIKHIRKLGDFLVSLYKKNSNTKWKWFEHYLAYSNSKLPEALLHAYLSTKNKYYLNVALSSLDFLISKTFEGEIFMPIGQNGWYYKDGERSKFDQQPVDVAYMIQTLLLAYKITNDDKYRSRALQTFQWFLGKNTLNQVIYNENTGGCHDGLGESAINLNQGAESTVSYLIARLSLSDLR